MSQLHPNVGQAETAPLRAAVFLDTDGTLVEHMPHDIDPATLRLMPGVSLALRRLAAMGYLLVVVTHQPGLEGGRVSRKDYARLQRALTDLLTQASGVELGGFFTCGHAPGFGSVPRCLCRTPSPGLLKQAALSLRLDLSRSWMVGDMLDDVEAGRRAGCRSVQVDSGNESEWRHSPLREPQARCASLAEAAEFIAVAPAALFA